MTWTIVGSRYSDEYTEYFVDGISAGLVVDNNAQHTVHVFARPSGTGAEIVDAIKGQQLVDEYMPTAAADEKKPTGTYAPAWASWSTTTASGR